MCGPLLALGITPSPTATFNPILEGGRRESKAFPSWTLRTLVLLLLSSILVGSQIY